MSAAKRKRRAHELPELRLCARRSLLLVVDVHEKLAPVIDGSERVVGNCAVLMRSASRLAVPILMSEHCPERLGPTVAQLRSLARGSDIISKVHFSCADEPALIERIAVIMRPQIVVAGMEAHVCVLQTALGLAEHGYRPYVVADATGSRRLESHAVAMERLRMANIPVVTTEMVLFEWLNRADRPELRALLALIK